MAKSYSSHDDDGSGGHKPPVNVDHTTETILGILILIAIIVWLIFGKLPSFF